MTTAAEALQLAADYFRDSAERELTRREVIRTLLALADDAQRGTFPRSSGSW